MRTIEVFSNGELVMTDKFSGKDAMVINTMIANGLKITYSGQEEMEVLSGYFRRMQELTHAFLTPEENLSVKAGLNKLSKIAWNATVLENPKIVLR